MIVAASPETLAPHYREQGLIYAQYGKTDDLRAWIGEHPKLLEIYGGTLLRRACKHGQRNCVTLLLEQHIDVNAQNHEGLTAIDAAAYHGHWQIVCDLLQKGADPDGSPREARHGTATPLMHAARAGNIAMMHQLQKADASVHYRDSKGQHLMFYAAGAKEHGAQAVNLALEMLQTKHLKKEAIINGRDHTQETPLHAAARARSAGAIEALVTLGAHTNIANVIGQTPVDLTQDAACQRALNPPQQGELLSGPGRPR